MSRGPRKVLRLTQSGLERRGKKASARAQDRKFCIFPQPVKPCPDTTPPASAFPMTTSIAFTAADVFLRSNGFYIEVEGLDGHAFIVGSMDRHEFRFAQILDWIRQHIKPLV